MNTLLGQRIREQRKEKGWTIEQFAERVDLSANYVGDLERGVKIPKLETFIRIVEVLDVSADVLIRDSVPSASHVADDELSRKLSQLTPGQKKPECIHRQYPLYHKITPMSRSAANVLTLFLFALK